MTQTSAPNDPIPPESTEPAAAGESVDVQLPAERSRFSKWLAKFGLGELTDPLLRPARPRLPARRLPM